MSIKKATLAGGCFWCMVMPFDEYEGVLSVVSGYCGSKTDEPPSYELVKSGRTDLVEAVEISFDDSRITFRELLDIFWMQIDPTDDGGQFGDRGISYRTAIFVHDEEQRQEAERSRAALQQSGTFTKPIVTRILPFARFYPAEAYHQDYARREQEKYLADQAVRERKAFLEQTWAKPANDKPAKD